MKELSDAKVQEIVNAVASKFRCFGGGRAIEGNPIAMALKDQEPQFAAGADVKSVVLFVLEQISTPSKT